MKFIKFALFTFLFLFNISLSYADTGNYDLPTTIQDNSFNLSDLVNKMTSCVKKANPQDRLDCYDQASISIKLVGSNTKLDEQLFSWDLQTSNSNLGQSQSSIGMKSTQYQDSAHDIAVKETRSANFVVSCLNGHTAFYLQFPEKLFTNPQNIFANYYIGSSGNTALGLQLIPSTDGSAIGLWNKTDVMSYLNNILFAKNITFKVPYNNNTQQIIVDFDIDGLSKALNPIREACNWSSN